MTVLLACLAGSMEALASFATEELGGLDVWVNNAGASQAPKAALVDTEPAALQAIVDTNLTCANAVVYLPLTVFESWFPSESRERCACRNIQGFAVQGNHGRYAGSLTPCGVLSCC